MNNNDFRTKALNIKQLKIISWLSSTQLMQGLCVLAFLKVSGRQAWFFNLPNY
jgi:hypothetical protein